MVQQIQFAQPVPIEVQQRAERHSLGTLATFYPKKTRSVGSWIILGVFIAIFYGVPAFIYWDLFSEFFNYSKGDYSQWPFLIPFVLFGIFWYGVLIVVLVSGYRNRNEQVYVYSEGFISHGGRKSEVVRWDQIQAVWRGKNGEKSLSSDMLRIGKADGKKLNVGQNIQDARALCDAIECAYIEHKLLTPL